MPDIRWLKSRLFPAVLCRVLVRETGAALE